jgi:GR25 family glycosyltransferase involved in LPS biosynthesis
MNFYCLHHSPAVDRKTYLLKIFDKKAIAINWVEDFLPNCNEVINQEKVFSEHAANGSYLNSAEISCFLKHLSTIKKIANSNEVGVIFEDDIEEPDFDLKSFCEYIGKYCNDNSIIFIGSYSGADLTPQNKNNYEIYFSKSFKSRCAHAYMLNSNTAKNILTELNKIILPFDWQLNHIIDKLNLKVGWTTPHINQRTEKGKLNSLLR